MIAEPKFPATRQAEALKTPSRVQSQGAFKDSNLKSLYVGMSVLKSM
jgi:hypothetical protein